MAIKDWEKLRLESKIGRAFTSLTVFRVIYGKESTPENKREYKAVFWGSPVGTKKEWTAWAKSQKKKIIFKENPKTQVFVEQLKRLK
jgi:hypothetical protein